MINLKTFNKSELEKLVHSERFKNFPFKPISFHRAISHIKNPRAGENETLLILAFEDQKIAGYIGILPDKIFKGNEVFSCGWLTTLWIHPEFRGKKIAQKLLSKACDEYKGQIIITEFTPEAENMYVKSDYFVQQKSLEGRSYHLRSNLKKILPSKNKKWKKSLPLLKLFDFSINSLIKFSQLFKTNSIHNFKAENNLDTESEAFIEKYSTKNSFNRCLKEIKWVVENPWIFSSKAKDENYHFSDYCENFEFIFFKIYRKSVLETLLLLSIRDENAKLHFIFGNQDAEFTAEILLNYLKTKNISNFISFEKNLNKHLNKRFFFYQKERNRKFMMHKELQKTLGKDFIFDISAGDSDSIFT